MDKNPCSSIEIEIIERPEDSGKRERQKQISNIGGDFIERNIRFWGKRWNEHGVAIVISDQYEVVIYVSEENKNLQKLVERAQRKNDSAVQNIKNKYLEHISFHAFVLDKNNPDTVLTKDDEEIPSESYEKIKESELRNVSETVCGMINDFFESIIIESVEQETVEVWLKVHITPWADKSDSDHTFSVLI